MRDQHTWDTQQRSHLLSDWWEANASSHYSSCLPMERVLQNLEQTFLSFLRRSTILSIEGNFACDHFQVTSGVLYPEPHYFSHFTYRADVLIKVPKQGLSTGGCSLCQSFNLLFQPCFFFFFYPRGKKKEDRNWCIICKYLGVKGIGVRGLWFFYLMITDLSISDLIKLNHFSYTKWKIMMQGGLLIKVIFWEQRFLL